MVIDNSDWFLGRILELAEGASPIPLDVTLATGGMLVSGRPIGSKAYFERVAEQLGAAQDRIGGGGETVREPFLQLAQIVEEERLQNQAEQDQLLGALGEGEQLTPEQESRFRRQYVNLEDVRMLGAGQQLIHTRIWRGRLSEVTGWNFGLLEGS